MVISVRNEIAYFNQTNVCKRRARLLLFASDSRAASRTRNYIFGPPAIVFGVCVFWVNYPNQTYRLSHLRNNMLCLETDDAPDNWFS